MYPIVYDLAAVFIIVIFMLISARRGFLSAFLRLLSWLLSLAGAYFISRLFAESVYRSFLRPTIYEALKDYSADFLKNTPSIFSGFDFGELMPGTLGNALSQYFAEPDSAVSVFMADQTTALIESGNKAVEAFISSVIDPVISGLVGTLLFFAAFSILMIVFKFMSRAFRGVGRVPVLGTINAILGSVIGFVEGALCVGIICLVLNLLIMLTNDSLPFISSALIDKTLLLRLIFGFLKF